MTEHLLKLHDRYFDAVKNGLKTYEIRRNDRDFKVGDTLILHRVGREDTVTRPSTGIQILATVTYMLGHDDFPDGIPEGYVVTAIRLEEDG